MSVTAFESSSPLDESQMATRRRRIARLARMVFDLMGERYQGGTNHEFDDAEDADLIAALRACSFYTEQIGCLNFNELFVIQIEGIDGHNYIIQFSLLGPGFTVHAARVRITKLSILAGQEGREDSSYNTMDVLPEYSKRLKLGRITTDRAFLLGMSFVISFMDDQNDDSDEDARLAPLLAQIMPSAEDLREIRAKLPPSNVNYDDEGDLPY